MYGSIQIATKWLGFAVGYDRPKPLRYYPGEFFTQGCTWVHIGCVRIALVWSNR